mgnify:CR=1 FL=1
MNRQINPVPETPEKKIPSVGFSVLTISVIAVFVGVCVGPLKMNVGLLLFLSWLLFAPFGAKLGYSFSELLEKAYEMGKNALPASAIILAVGIMMGTWLAAGDHCHRVGRWPAVYQPQCLSVGDDAALLLCILNHGFFLGHRGYRRYCHVRCGHWPGV